ncbi:hypothetical protein TWF506_008783 [Arthrobotrys conoides]|uniref:Uncharacterized protein n=1 Tax=Arthrobotrys conoides TaxID=74498 RepID=A0AAN8NP20_9PEZI
MPDPEVTIGEYFDREILEIVGIIQRPFKFDDNRAKWPFWRYEMMNWIRRHHHLLTNNFHALVEFKECTEEETLAGILIYNVVGAVLSSKDKRSTTQAEQAEAFEKLENKIQVYEWLIDLLTPYFKEWRETENLRKIMSKPQGRKPVFKFLVSIDKAGEILGCSEEEKTKAFHNTVRKDLKIALAGKLQKDVEELTFWDFWNGMNRVEWEQKALQRELNRYRKHSSNSSGEEQQLESERERDSRQKPTRWSDEDFELVKGAGACYNCGYTNHKNVECRKPRNRVKKLSEKSIAILKNTISKKERNKSQPRGRGQKSMVQNSECKKPFYSCQRIDVTRIAH